MRYVLFISSITVVLSAGVASASPEAVLQKRNNIQQPEPHAVGESVTSQRTSDAEFIRDRDGAIMGRIDAAGYIYDRHNRIVAQHDISGYLLNVDGTLLMRDRISREAVIQLFFSPL